MSKKLNTNLSSVVALLNDGDYHDGTTMGDQLGITRSGVWKVIKKLENYGVKLDSIKGKGYAMLEPLILLDPKKIKKQLYANIDLVCFESVSSTNDYFAIKPFSRAIKVCLAEQQTEGKGRMGRKWHSPFAQNIYLSCLYPFQKDISELAGLSLVTSLAIVDAINQHGVSGAKVKWPNDIVYDNKKLSGTLIEVAAEAHGISYATIGIGINVNMVEDKKEISQSWTSLRKILNQYIDRNELCISLINNLLTYLQRFEAKGFEVFVNEWMQKDSLMKRAIALKVGNQTIEGKVVGINEQGHLLLKLKDGSTRAFSSGDTSIIKDA